MKCLNPYVVNNKGIVNPLRYTNTITAGMRYLVPCGKCSACIKSRQDDVACRVAREAVKRGSMFFVTFTYSDASLPISVCLVSCDVDTGETFTPYVYQLLDDSPLLDSLRCEFHKMSATDKPRYIIRSAPFFAEDNYEFYYEFTPSLRREDFRLWLKRARVNYEREFGEKLDFSYCCTGEYGPRTCRPHFHCCFMGLTRRQLNYMLADWNSRFGFSQLKQVRLKNDNGSNGFVCAAKYVGKYVSKGVFECPSVQEGACEKPRLMLSKGLGADLTENEISYYSCFDLFGKYDKESLLLDSGRRLSPDQLDLLKTEIYKRSFIVVGGQEFILPKNVRDKLWKYVEKNVDKNGKVIFRKVRTYKIRTLSAESSLLDFMRDSSSKLQEYCAPYQTIGARAAAVMRYNSLCESRKSFKETSREKTFQKFYSKSIF